MTPRELLFVIRTTAAVFADPTRLGDLLAVCEILNRSTLQRMHHALEREPAGQRVLSERPEMTTTSIDLGALRALPPGTLGRAFVEHLDTHALDLDVLAVPPRREDEDADIYLLRRYRGSHDVCHALLGLGVTVRDEVLVNAFSWGNVRLPQNRVIVVLGALRHLATVREPRAVLHFLRDIGRHVRRGRGAAPLLSVRWEDLWTLELREVQRALALG